MSSSAITDLLGRYLEERSPESYLLLREAVAASSDYVPYGASPEGVLSQVEEGKYENLFTWTAFVQVPALCCRHENQFGFVAAAVSRTVRLFRR